MISAVLGHYFQEIECTNYGKSFQVCDCRAGKAFPGIEGKITWCDNDSDQNEAEMCPGPSHILVNGFPSRSSLAPIPNASLFGVAEAVESVTYGKSGVLCQIPAPLHGGRESCSASLNLSALSEE